MMDKKNMKWIDVKFSEKSKQKSLELAENYYTELRKQLVNQYVKLVEGRDDE